MCPELSLSDGT